uniref:Uncharacterized protein n=1 Tax=Arundo donax TaxID=35708 RepID=A0A0A9HPS3_ARUDO
MQASILFDLLSFLWLSVLSCRSWITGSYLLQASESIVSLPSFR